MKRFSTRCLEGQQPDGWVMVFPEHADFLIKNAPGYKPEFASPLIARFIRARVEFWIWAHTTKERILKLSGYNLLHNSVVLWLTREQSQQSEREFFGQLRDRLQGDEHVLANLTDEERAAIMENEA